MMDAGNRNLMDQRLAEATADAGKRYSDYVLKIDESLDALRFTPADRWGHPLEIIELDNLVGAARNLAWALRRFPVFDMSCMKMMRKEKGLKVTQREWNGVMLNYELDLWVPVFAASAYHASQIIENWNPLNNDYKGHPLEERMQQENRTEIQTKAKNNSVMLTACAPGIPQGVMKKVDLVKDRFQETQLLWEAQWSAYARVEDPLVIGRIGNISFLIDQFDATKLERYVLGEFCKNPK